MNKAEKTSREWFQAKTDYVQNIQVLDKLDEDLGSRDLTPKQAARVKKKIEDRIQKLNAAWEKLENVRTSYLYENNKDSNETEEWGEETHSFACEELRKEKLVERAEDSAEKLGEDTSHPKNVAVMSEIQETLSKVEVSRNDMVEFEKHLSEQLVEDWSEDSQTKIYKGIAKEDFKEFLDLLQSAAGFNQEVKDSFLASAFGEDHSDAVKSFNCEGTDLNGKYGMTAVMTQRHNRDGKEKLDVCYSVFTFKTTLLGPGGTNDPIVRKKSNKNSRNPFGKTQIQDVMTGEKGNSNRHLKVKDITALTQNFIVTKALQAFADAGVIPFVRYREDSVSQLSQLSIRNDPRGARDANGPHSTA